MGLLAVHALMSILAIWLVCLVSQTSSICCRPTVISFELSLSAEGESCEYFGGSSDENGSCSAAICNDGKAVKKMWCGRGSCDSSGCRCKRGCIKPQFDPIQTMRFLIVSSAVMACILLLWLPPLAMAVCCRPTRIRFAVKPSIEERNCNTYGGEPDKRKKTCKAAICNDGHPVTGQWCGIGQCDATGCRCKYGCVKPRSDAVKTFLDKNGFSKFFFVRKAPAIVDN